MTALDVTSQILIVVGAGVFATAGLGLLRFRDAYARVSAVGTAGGFGVALITLGALGLQPNVPDLIKVVLIVALQLGTSAIGSMAIARATYLAGVPMSGARYNDLDPQQSP